MKILPLLTCLFALLLFPVVSSAAEPLSCRYFSVTLPDDWRVIEPPLEQRQTGMTRAHFARQNGSTAVIMIIGPTGGLDAKTIAQIYAQQYKTQKDPVEKDGQYTFPFTQQKISCLACISVQDETFMFTVFMGNQRDAQNFVRKNFKSPDYAKLMPR